MPVHVSRIRSDDRAMYDEVEVEGGSVIGGI